MEKKVVHHWLSFNIFFFFHLKLFSFFFFAVAPKLVTPSSSFVLLKHKVLGSGPGCPRQRRQHPGPRTHQHHQPVPGTRGRLQTNWGPDSGGEGRRSQPGRSLRLFHFCQTLKLPKNTQNILKHLILRRNSFFYLMFCHQSGRQFADAWCLLGYTKAWMQKKKNVEKWGWGGGSSPGTRNSFPVCLCHCAIHLFCIYGLQPGSSPMGCETCLKRALPCVMVGLGMVVEFCPLCPVSTHLVSERRKNFRALTDWQKWGFRSASARRTAQCQVMWYQDDAPSSPDFFLSSILEFGNERCHRRQVDQSSIPQPS